MGLTNEKAPPLQQGSQYPRMIHESFGFATTYHERQEEQMSAFRQISQEANGVPTTGITFMGKVEPQRNW